MILIFVISIFVRAASRYREGIDAGENNQEKDGKKAGSRSPSIAVAEAVTGMIMMMVMAVAVVVVK